MEYYQQLLISTKNYHNLLKIEKTGYKTISDTFVILKKATHHIHVCVLVYTHAYTKTAVKFISMNLRIENDSHFHYPCYITTSSSPTMMLLQKMSHRLLIIDTAGIKLFRRAASAEYVARSYQCPLQWRLFSQERPCFLSVFPQGESRVHPACCLCRVWWEFPWVWMCLSRHCILLWKVREGQKGWGWSLLGDMLGDSMKRATQV